MYKESAKGWLKHLDFLILDLLVLILGLIISFSIVWRDFNIIANRRLSVITLLFVFSLLFTVFFTQPFKNILKRGYLIEAFLSLRHVSTVVVMFIMLLFFLHQMESISRSFIVYMFLFYLILTYFVRIVWKKVLLNRFKKGGNKKSMLLITSYKYAEGAVENLTNSDLYDFFLCGIIIADRSLNQDRFMGIPVLENSLDTVNNIVRDWIDEVFIYLPRKMTIANEYKVKFRLLGIPIHECLAVIDNIDYYKENIQQIGCYAVVTSGIHIVSHMDLLYKRMLDIAGSLIGCFFTCIIFIFIAPAILIQSPGAPVIFSQMRVGQNGKLFKIYKFRSMYPGSEDEKQKLCKENEVRFKLEEDPRVITTGKRNKKGQLRGIGFFIRRTSLDEFPQFFNVLKGDMSLVGTRPPTLDEWNKYSEHHRARMRVKPGITGLWQVEGRSNIMDIDEVVKLDFEYIQNWSFSLDIKILLKTLKVVITKEGAM